MTILTDQWWAERSVIELEVLAILEQWARMNTPRPHMTAGDIAAELWGAPTRKQVREIRRMFLASKHAAVLPKWQHVITRSSLPGQPMGDRTALGIVNVTLDQITEGLSALDEEGRHRWEPGDWPAALAARS